MRQTIPLSKRPVDIIIVIFFLVNVLFITYLVDLEQVVIPNVAHFTYPIWPPASVVDLIHWWGRSYDPLINARPAWWKMTIWLDVLCFGPFYVVAIFAYSKGKEWIRFPSVIYSSVMMTNVLIIFGDEYGGVNATPHFPIVFLENLPWLLFPMFIIYRMWRYQHPFTRDASEEQAVPMLSGPIEAVGDV